MKVFKFGGASVKDTAGVKNIIKVLNSVGFENTLSSGFRHGKKH